MTLENLLRTGQLKAHAADEREILRLLDSAQLALKDAALAAILANGYRPSTSEPGHHQLLLQALPKTIGLARERVQVLEAFRKARNQNDYRGVPVSDATARECAEEAGRLLAEVRAWLDAHRQRG
jgi:hypothetical protein